MRAKDFIKESSGVVGNGDTGYDKAMPPTYALPQLKNQDPYLQYRFGLAIAAARAHANGEVKYQHDSDYGENMVVLARSPEEEKTLDMALSLYGKDNAKRLITTSKSEEMSDTNTKSPIQASKKVKSRS